MAKNKAPLPPLPEFTSESIERLLKEQGFGAKGNEQVESDKTPVLEKVNASESENGHNTDITDHSVSIEKSVVPAIDNRKPVQVATTPPGRLKSGTTKIEFSDYDAKFLTAKSQEPLKGIVHLYSNPRSHALLTLLVDHSKTRGKVITLAQILENILDEHREMYRDFLIQIEKEVSQSKAQIRPY